LYESHPTDPRRWTAWDALLRSVPRFADDAAAKKLWDERTAALETAVEASSDAPESLRELFNGRKVSALVLPFTNGTLPADWAERLVPPIEELAARFPGGSGAFVYFSRLVSALEAQQPAALPALVARLEASPNARVRELGEKRRRVLLALKRPLELWCVPCIQAIPKLKALYARYHDQGLEIVNISVDNANARPALEKLVAKLEIPWPQFFDGKAHATEYAVRYGVQPIPHVLLAGPDGMIVAVNPTPEKLEAEIKRLLKL
jgi:thiol-disulfide isomerase/thioredoxin